MSRTVDPIEPTRWDERGGQAGLRRSCLVVILALWAGVGSLTHPRPARAQDPPDGLTIALYAPSVYFEDSLARAGFIDTVAAHVANEVGLSVQGVNISSPSDLDTADFAVVDGIYFAAARPGEPIGSAEGSSGTAEPLALITSSSGRSRLADLSGSTLILPRAGDRLLDFVNTQILHGEVDAETFFGSIEYTSNIESALSAVAQGRADCTVAFAGYGDGSGLSVLDRYAAAPMPVVVQLNAGLSPPLAAEVAQAIRGAPGGSRIDGFTRYDGEAVSTFERRARASRLVPSPIMARSRGVTVPPGDIELPNVEEDLVVGTPVGLFEPPRLEAP